MYSGGCVLIYHASGSVCINHQVAIKVTETVKAKLTLEREDKCQGLRINLYPTENGIFNTSKFYGGAVEKAAKDKV